MDLQCREALQTAALRYYLFGLGCGGVEFLFCLGHEAGCRCGYGFAQFPCAYGLLRMPCGDNNCPGLHFRAEQTVEDNVGFQNEPTYAGAFV